MKYMPQPSRQDYVTSKPVERGHGELAARRLKIYAFDPQLGRRRKHRISIEVPYEPLAPYEGADEGRRSRPQGRLLAIVDYDAHTDRHYKLIDLDDPGILYGGGLEPTVDSPQFHQQMVYAVAMKTVANFERALGRRLDVELVTALPHAFYGHNAFFDPVTDSLCFGYFTADEDNPGDNLPNQWIFTCLSADIIAHEMTHAIIHRLRPLYLEPTNEDVYAFHEAMADIVAIFQHFSFPGVLADAIQTGRGDLSQPGPLLDLARQFGHSTGSGEALRTAADAGTPDPTLYKRTFEPHDRGSVLVGAVFAAFFATYTSRVADLIRLATGGTGILGDGHLHPDLVNRLTQEAGDTAQRVLDLCIRAFEYLPPIDITFGDLLRALVTADTELNPDDPFDLRANLVDAFLERGIHPEGAFSLNESSLLWDRPHRDMVDDPLGREFFARLAAYEASRRSDSEGDGADDSGREHAWEISTTLHGYAVKHAVHLGLQPHTNEAKIQVKGFHTMFNVGQDGQLLTEASVQFVQTPKNEAGVDLGGLVARAGVTVVFTGEGTPKYMISKPLGLDAFGVPAPDDERLVRMRTFVDRCDRVDPHSAWADRSWQDDRMRRRFSFALLHQGAQSARRRNAARDSDLVVDAVGQGREADNGEERSSDGR
ncbi:MAG: hypothetical protein GY724_14360 [Actinomycetia bacterium]|nr:hypothetical protein [Actinomycetes bacterium]